MGSFNTSHVTLYRIYGKTERHWITFQYISCYSLSPAWLYFVKFEGSFNTSHVTLYLRLPNGLQYCIRSFNTSHVTLYRAKEWAMEHLECEFQYISCYSLSDSAYIRYLVVLCFNTSHVTLYQ